MDGKRVADSHAPPKALVSPTRRLSCSFAHPCRPVPATARKHPAWISLQGPLFGAAEASSARAIGGLSPREAVAWELFHPIHRVLIVAIASAAASQSLKNRQILELQKSVHLRDELISSMQLKMDELVNNINDQTKTGAGMLSANNVETGCWLCHRHQSNSNDFGGNLAVKACGDMFNYVLLPTNMAEQEERRMSDLSDWSYSSGTSSAEIQLNTSTLEQDIFNLKRACEEKDATIEKLSKFICSSDINGSKTISELEAVLRRKNQLITKLRKDMTFQEQQVKLLSRPCRCSISDTSTGSMQRPLMADNLLYDMDSTTSPSSSDSDCFPKCHRRLQTPVAKYQDCPVPSTEFSSKGDQKLTPQTPTAKSQDITVPNTEISLRKMQDSGPQTPADRACRTPVQRFSLRRNQILTPPKALSHMKLSPSKQRRTSLPESPLSEKSMSRRSNTAFSKTTQLSESGSPKIRKRIAASPKDSVPPKKWVYPEQLRRRHLHQTSQMSK